MIIRPMTEHDAGGVAEVHVLGWQRGYRGIVPDEALHTMSISQRRERWLQNLKNPIGVTCVCEEQGQIRGFITFGPARDEAVDPKAVGELMALYVHPDHWARGYGMALWRHALTWFEQQGFDSVIVWVFRDNHRARRFYDRIGFVFEPGTQKPLPWGNFDAPEVRHRLALGNRISPRQTGS